MDKAKKQRNPELLLDVLNVFVASVALILPLYIWRIGYPHEDFTLAALVLLAPFLFVGRRLVAFAIYKARMNAVIRSTSWIRKVFTGKSWSFFQAGVFTIVAIFILSYQALVLNDSEGKIMIALCIVASIAFLLSQSMTQKHLKAPFANSGAITIATLICTIIFIPAIVWINYDGIFANVEVISKVFSEKTINEILREHIDENLPSRRGKIAEGLAFFYAYESTKFWVVASLDSPKWGIALLSIEAALISFILTRSSITLTLLIQTIFEKGFGYKTFSYDANVSEVSDAKGVNSGIQSDRYDFLAVFGYTLIIITASVILSFIPSPDENQPRENETFLESFLRGNGPVIKISKIQNEVNRLRGEQKDLKTQNSVLEATLEQKNAEINELDGVYEEKKSILSSEFDERKAILIEDYENQRGELNKQLAELKTSIDELRGKFENYSSAHEVIEVTAKFREAFAQEVLDSMHKEKHALISESVDTILDDIYNPIYDKIPEYREYYFSNFGEYMRPEKSAFVAINLHLYRDFDKRASESEEQYNGAIVSEYTNRIEKAIEDKFPLSTRDKIMIKIITEALKAERNIAFDRAKRFFVSIPGLETPTESISSAMTQKIIEKGAQKTIEREIDGDLAEGNVVPDDEGRGAFCPFKEGFFARAAFWGCGKKIDIWISKKEFIVKIHDYFPQDEFEAELRALIDQDKAAKRELLMQAFGEGDQ